MKCHMRPHDDQEDDRFDRWCRANGVVAVGWRTLSDGSVQMIHQRADGSIVNEKESYGYNDPLTPYTAVKGRA